MSTTRRSLRSRRDFLKAAGCLTTGALLSPRFAWAQSGKLKIGLMLPYTGTYAALGNAITNGFNLAHTGVYKDLQSVPPGGQWRESFWISTSGF